MADILTVRNLTTEFLTPAGHVRAVDEISFSIPRGGTVGLVGESGCGKSVTSLSIMRLVSSPGVISTGEILFNGVDLAKVPETDMRRFRGNKISMIFQEPMTSLNPVYTVGNQISEAISLHLNLGPKETRDLAIDMLRQVGIPSPEKRIDEYPHQMSGGMKQRVMIAMALVCKPDLLIADEPTTALDVTIQAQILDLLNSLQKSLGMSILMITHDLGVVAEVSDDVAVMYAGKVVERGDARDIFRRPLHPYTIGLFRSLPSMSAARGGRLPTIPGMVPSPLDFPTGCRFRTRCPFATATCAQSEPTLKEVGGGHAVACHFASEIESGAKAATGPFIDGRTIVKSWSEGTIGESIRGGEAP
ncbi:MAG: ABC transporter ATP-binding protein [Verrucomicrobiota bacterium]